jgi:hypothetical protein
VTAHRALANLEVSAEQNPRAANLLLHNSHVSSSSPVCQIPRHATLAGGEVVGAAVQRCIKIRGARTSADLNPFHFLFSGASKSEEREPVIRNPLKMKEHRGTGEDKLPVLATGPEAKVAWKMVRERTSIR